MLVVVIFWAFLSAADPMILTQGLLWIGGGLIVWDWLAGAKVK